MRGRENASKMYELFKRHIAALRCVCVCVLLMLRLCYFADISFRRIEHAVLIANSILDARNVSLLGFRATLEIFTRFGKRSQCCNQLIDMMLQLIYGNNTANNL